MRAGAAHRTPQAVAAAVSALALLGSVRAAPAQVPIGTDTTTLPRSAPERPQKPDSVQEPFTRHTPLHPVEVGQSYTFRGEALRQTGALTLADLLERIPGLTVFRTGWIASPQLASYGGDFGRVRVLLDGVELDDLSPRDAGVPDLRTIPLWALDAVTVERGPTELRISLTTWDYAMTKPYTRVDALTGDLNTNLYRGYYARRHYNGAGLQVAFQQYGTTNTREGGGGDEAGVMARFGVARRLWSADVTAVRLNDSRDITQRFFGRGMLLPPYRAGATVAYARATIGRAGAGPFLQLLASTNDLRETSPHFDAARASQYGFPADTADTVASVAQYVATAGIDAGPLRLRLVERYRRRAAQGFSSPSASLGVNLPLLSVLARAERDGYAGLTRLEASGRIAPLPFLAVVGAVGERRPLGTSSPFARPEPASRSARVEGGVRIGGALWISGGAVVRDTAVLVPPAVFDTAYVAVPAGRQRGATFAVRGALGHGFSVDAFGTRWRTHSPYVPEYQFHGELRFFTRWLSKFPSGNFSFLLAPSVDYRSIVSFPAQASNVPAAASRVYSLLAEIRILRGTITYERRNLQDVIYEQVPGFVMPRGVNFYGVRWYFYN